MARMGICMRNVDDVLNAYHIDVEKDDVGEIPFTNNLCEMRKLVGSDVVSILSAKVAGMPVRLITVHDPKNSTRRKVSGLDKDGKVLLHGSIVVVGSHMEGDDEVLNSLSPEQMSRVVEHVGLVDIGKEESRYNTYVLCDIELRG